MITSGSFCRGSVYCQSPQRGMSVPDQFTHGQVFGAKFRFFPNKIKPQIQFCYFIHFSVYLPFNFFSGFCKLQNYIFFSTSTFYAALLFRSLVTTFLVTRRATTWRIAGPCCLFSFLCSFFLWSQKFTRTSALHQTKTSRFLKRKWMTISWILWEEDKDCELGSGCVGWRLVSYK